MPTCRPLAVAVAVALSVTATFAAPAIAAPPKPNKQARKFEKKARKAYARKRWDDALSGFELAYEADALPRYLFNIGRCYEKKDDLPQAVKYVERYLTEVTDPEERDDAQASLLILQKKLRKTMRRVRVAGAPDGARIRWTRGEEVIEELAPFDRWIPLGTYRVDVTAADREPWSKDVELAPGPPMTVTVALKGAAPAPTAPPPPPPAKSPVAEPEPESEPEAAPEPSPEPEAEVAAPTPAQPVTPPPPTEEPHEPGVGVGTWAALGGGGALLAAGAAFGVLSQRSASEVQHYRDIDRYGYLADAESQQETAEQRALLANVFLISGGVAVAVGGTLLALDLLDDGDGEPAAAAVRVVPVPGGAVLMLGGGR